MAVALVLFIVTALPIISNAVEWTNTYGTCTGTSKTYTWSQSNSPTYRRISATTKCTNAAPKIAAEVYGYYNGTLVMSKTNTASNAKTVTATSDNSTYANKTISGNGCHAVWSSSLSRVNKYSSF